MAIITSLFHDSGYIRHEVRDENFKNGAEFTLYHVSRSADFLRRYLPELGLSHDVGVSSMIVHFTGYELDLDKIELPLRYHFEPLVVGVNHALRVGEYKAVHMVGFSAGAFFTTVMAAIDERIDKSYPIAGVYPIYLREGAEIQPELASYYPPLLAMASYLDLFVLGASGAGRRQFQIFNRYDRCCYNNTKGKLYESVVADAVRGIGVGGGFAVLIDESHADHRISEAALEAVLADMEAESQ